LAKHCICVLIMDSVSRLFIASAIQSLFVRLRALWAKHASVRGDDGHNEDFISFAGVDGLDGDKA